MAFKDTWVDKIDGVDGVLAEDINSIANEVIAAGNGKEDKANKVGDFSSIDNPDAYPSVTAVMNDVYLPHDYRIMGLEAEMPLLEADIALKEIAANKVSDVWAYASDENAYPNAPSVAAALMETAQAKEDISNKVSEIDEDALPEVKADLYPNMGATIDFVNAKVGWELIEESTTLTHDVPSITKSFDNNYIKIFIQFLIPTAKTGEITTVEKGRVNSTINDIATQADQAYYLEDNGNIKQLTILYEMLGNLCYSSRTWTSNVAQARYESASLQTVASTYGVDLNNPYITKVLINHYSLNNIQKFFTGTTYRIWGVKA